MDDWNSSDSYGHEEEQEGLLPHGIVDIHAHFFPARMFEAIWEYFENHNWRINYKDDPGTLVDMLRGFGVTHFTVLNYLHRPGLRDSLAEWTRDFTGSQPGAIPFGTLYPGEEGNLEAARLWFEEWGFRGIKMQPLVSEKPIADPSMIPVYEMMSEMGKWLVIHAGTAPYPNEFTSLDFLEELLDAVPGLPVILAHMGGYEYEKAVELMERFPNLYLDTTMIFVETYVFDSRYPLPVERLDPFRDRIMFGSDFPNIPYDYTESIDGLLRAGFDDDFLRRIFYDNAAKILELK